MKRCLIMITFLSNLAWAHQSDGHHYFFLKESTAGGKVTYISKVIRCTADKMPQSTGYGKEDLYGAFDSFEQANQALDIELKRTEKRGFKSKILNFDYQCQSRK